MSSLRIVVVSTQTEVARAEAAGDDPVRYTGADVAESLVTRTAKERGISDAEAVAALASEGWSNGYLMVAMPGLPKPLTP